MLELILRTCHKAYMGGGIDAADTSPTLLIVHLSIYTAHHSVPVTALDTVSPRALLEAYY
jgi:hypothetical protein